MSTGTYEYQTDFVRRPYNQGKTEGKAEGEIKSLLTVLAARGFTMPTAMLDRVTSCTDFDQLEVWIKRAATANTLDEVFC